jgi:hypothetical protein
MKELKHQICTVIDIYGSMLQSYPYDRHLALEIIFPRDFALCFTGLDIPMLAVQKYIFYTDRISNPDGNSINVISVRNST